ncbi:MAG: DEAD/DEAH box helicase, partial [Acidimicrobiia bacterium]|nr:DEAD/DEAH box helicase [Acidimicrobiia bacterium]
MKGAMERFAIGDKVTRLAGREEGVVVGVDDRLWDEVLLPSGAVYLDKSEIERTPYRPEEALRRANLSNAELYGLRIQALYLQHAYRYDELAGLSNARIEPAFHQVMVALQVLSKTRPRMILADEVGLGKTIEAGMILKELRARRMIDRVLIVVPPSLQWQWRQELSSKFNEDFEVLDGPIIRSRVRRGENPWLRYD